MLPRLAAPVRPLSISVLTAQIRTKLETAFPTVWVIGEAVGVKVHQSGHVYFTLRDKDAQMPAVMWRSTAQRLRYAVKDGLEVIIRGRIGVHPPQGRYQLQVDDMFQAGDGQQELALKQLKEKLATLGYFTRERKKPLPTLPRRIALVTSPTGAALRDMLSIITRRWPCAEIWVVGVRVQGTGAAQTIALALDRLNQFDGVDVIILGRGGGSSEDLAAFNDELVARAIFLSRIPIVSAVGHEIDTTIADAVADRRAATPSEAAELATPDRDELVRKLRARKERLVDLLNGKFQSQKQRLHHLQQRRVFRVPLDRVRNEERRLDDWDARIMRTLQTRIAAARRRLEALAARLESLSPLNVLARGYSLTRTVPDKHVVRSVDQVAVGARVEIVLADGKLEADVVARDREK